MAEQTTKKQILVDESLHHDLSIAREVGRYRSLSEVIAENIDLEEIHD